MNPITPPALPLPLDAPLGGLQAARPRGRRRKRRAKLAPLISGWMQSMDMVRVAIAGMIIVSISAVHMYLGPLQYARPSMTLLVGAVGMVALKPSLLRWTNLRESWPALAVLAFFVLAVVFAPFGLSMGGSLTYIMDKYSKTLVFYFLTVLAIRNVRDLAMLLWAYVISIGIVVILAFTVLELEPTHAGLGRLEGGSSMFDANDVGMICLMCLPIALLCFLNAKKLGKIVAGFTLAGIPLVIALTGSRGALVGLAIVLPVLFFALSRISIVARLSVAAVVMIGLFLGAPAGYWKQMGTILNPSEDYNTSAEYGRIGIAKRGLGYMMRYPITGVGIVNFPRAEGTISPIAKARAAEGLSVEWIAPHNTYVQVGAELGFPGLIIWLSLLFGGSVGLWKLRKKMPKRWDRESPDRRFLREATLFLPMSFIAFAVTSFFLTHAYTPPAYIIFSYHAAIVVLARRELKRDKQRLRRQLMAPPPRDAPAPLALAP